VDLTNKSYITVQGFEITNAGFAADTNPSICVNGTTGVQIVSNYVHDTTNSTATVRSSSGIGRNKAHNLRIASNTITNSGVYGARSTILELWGDDMLIEGNDLSHGRDFLIANGSRIVFRNNKLHDAYNIESGSLAHLDGFQGYCNVAGSIPYEAVNYMLVEGNYYHDNPDANEHFGLINSTAACGGSTTIIIRGNIISNLGEASYIADLNQAYADHHKYYNNTTVNGGVANKQHESVTLKGSTYGSVFNNIFVDAVLPTAPADVYLLDGSGTSKGDYNLGYLSTGSIPWALAIDSEPHHVLNQDPLFLGATDFHLRTGSPATGAGGPLTTVAATDSGGGTTLVTTDAHFFQPGWGGAVPDWIAVGSTGNTVRIASINYSTNTITLANAITRSPGQPIWLFKNSSGSAVLSGAGPDIGASAYFPADISGPTVFISAPTSGGSVAGVSSIASATAYDNWGVAGVQFKLDGVNLGPEDTTSPYSIAWDTTTKTIGSHLLAAVARDAAGNRTTSSAVTVMIIAADVTAPTVSISSPIGGATIGGTSSTVSATASDNVGVIGVQFQLDGVNLGAEDTGSPYSIAWYPSTTTPGPHVLTAVARDAAGNQTTSAPVTITVTSDTTAPTVSVSAPTGGSTVSGTAVVVSATASDNVGVVGVQFKLDGANLAAEDTTSPYSITWNSTTTTPGSHALTAVARDAAGNRTTSASVSVTVAADTTPPTVSISSPIGGSTVSGTAAIVSATASDNVGVVGVQFKLDGVNLGAEDTTSPYSTTWNTTTSMSGSHALTAVARDAAGNQKTSASVTVTVADTTAPTVSILSPIGGSTVGGTAAVVSATASDNVGVVGVQFKLDGVNLATEDTTSPYSITWNPTTTTSGSHALTAVARDAAGNRTTSVAVNVIVSDTTAPTVVISSPIGRSSVSSSATIVSATASDDVGVIGVQFKLDGVALGVEATTSPYSTTWDTTMTVNGPHVLTAVARDEAGNYTTSAPVTAIVVDDTTAPTVVISSPIEGSIVGGSATIVSATASDDVGVIGVQFKLDGVDLGVEATTSPYSTTWDTTTTVNGPHVLTAVARDGAGNSATSAPVSVDVDVNVNTSDTTAPAILISAPIGGSTVGGSSVTISSTASDNVGVVGVQFKLDGVNLGAEVTSSPYTTTWDAATLSGSHTLTAVARDAAANQTTSAPVTVNVVSAAVPYSIAKFGGDSWNITNTGSLQKEYARLLSGAGTTLPSGVAIVGFRSAGVLLSETGVQASPPASDGRIYTEISAFIKTGIALANPTDLDTLVSFYFTDEFGTDFGDGSFTLAAKQQVSAFLDQPPFNGPASLQGTFTFTSTIPISAVGERGFTNERGEFLITAFPGTPLAQGFGGGVLMFPRFGNGVSYPGVVLTNPTDSPLSGTIQFFGPGSSGNSTAPIDVVVSGITSSTFAYAVPPGGQFHIVPDGIAAMAKIGSGRRVTSARITPDINTAFPSAMSLFSYRDPQGMTFSQASLPASPAGSAFRFYVESSGIYGASGSIRTWFSIFNPSVATSIRATATLFNLDGTSTGLGVSIDLLPGGQTEWLVNDLLKQMPTAFQGILRITTNGPGIVTALRKKYNERGDFLIASTPPWNEVNVSSGWEKDFPQIASGGGYETQVIIFSNSTVSSSSGTLWFVNEDGDLVMHSGL